MAHRLGHAVQSLLYIDGPDAAEGFSAERGEMLGQGLRDALAHAERDSPRRPHAR